MFILGIVQDLPCSDVQLRHSLSTQHKPDRRSSSQASCSGHSMVMMLLPLADHETIRAGLNLAATCNKPCRSSLPSHTLKKGSVTVMHCHESTRSNLPEGSCVGHCWDATVLIACTYRKAMLPYSVH